MNQKLEKYLLNREKELEAPLDKSKNKDAQLMFLGSLQEISLIFSTFGYTEKTAKLMRLDRMKFK